MTLERLVLKNFQVHKDLEIEFAPGVTTLVGPTDQGKSTIIRALVWLYFNQPSGEEFITHGESDCSVTLTTDQHTIERFRGPGGNGYRLDGKEFRALGQGVVPEDIRRVLLVSETNVQSQLDPPFWFTLPPGQVAKELNTVVDLSLIDESLDKIAREVRAVKAEVDLTSQRLESARQKRRELEWVEEMAIDLHKLQKLEGQVKASQQECGLLTSLVKDVTSLDRQLSDLGRQQEGLEELAALAKQVRDLSVDEQGLDQVLQEINRKEKELCQTTEDREELEAEMTRKLGGRCPLCGSRNVRFPSISPTSI